MNEQGAALQQAIRDRRQGMRPLRVWVLLSCPNTTCATMEVNVFVDESSPGIKPWQAPARCPRCSAELRFEGLEHEEGDAP
jgi:aspartate carbamoyltransferase regulatory subunit